MSKVRFGIIGLGNMGSSHVKYLPGIPDVEVTALCDLEPAKLEKSKAFAPNAKTFTSSDEMLNAKVCDAVIVATPHYDHPPIGIKALETGHHLLCEKPIAVGTKAAHQLIEVSNKYPKLKFGLMFNQRTNPMYAKLRNLITEGDLGEITRVTWIVTDWFRTWSYYASGGWRTTWAGEGGGVLINQCPHNLDLLQWITGLMPTRITAVGFIGKTHPIEVEDEMSAILEYPNGAIGHFITTTGEAPGTNRLEICGTQGKIIAEKGKLTFTRTRKNVREIREKSPDAFAMVERWEIDIPFGKEPAGQGEHERHDAQLRQSHPHRQPDARPGRRSRARPGARQRHAHQRHDPQTRRPPHRRRSLRPTPPRPRQAIRRQENPRHQRSQRRHGSQQRVVQVTRRRLIPSPGIAGRGLGPRRQGALSKQIKAAGKFAVTSHPSSFDCVFRRRPSP
ncbi:MAG: Gfo/Idh/MocA family oxidoreductase [Tepidisphaeraceae bacterium]